MESLSANLSMYWGYSVSTVRAFPLLVIHARKRAQPRDDFVHKVATCEKEAAEAEILVGTGNGGEFGRIGFNGRAITGSWRTFRNSSAKPTAKTPRQIRNPQSEIIIRLRSSSLPIRTGVIPLCDKKRELCSRFHT